MIASFTQTYGDKRILELKLLKHDLIGNYFRNKCDLIIFSFHNCPPKFIEESKKILNEIYPKEKLLFLEYHDITYLQCIEDMCKIVKDKDIKFILQIQDDQHGVNNNKNCHHIQEIDTLFRFLEEYEPKYLHIFEKEGDKNTNQLIPLEEMEIEHTFFYKYDTRDFKKNDLWGWNDGTYFIQTDFFIELLSIIDKKDQCVWWVEWNLRTLFDNNSYIRWGINKEYFKRSNLHGRNTSKSLPSDNLSQMFGELSNWEEIKCMIEEFF